VDYRGLHSVACGRCIPTRRFSRLRATRSLRRSTTARSGCARRECGATPSADFTFGAGKIIVAAAVTLPLGITQSKEYAELEWPIDIAIAVVWLVIFGGNFLMTLIHRRERHMYVALWFYIATIVTVALLHVFNNLVLPSSLVPKLSDLCGRPRCLYAVVVWSQRGRVLLDDSVSGVDVLLPAQGSRTPGVQLQAEHHSLLVVGLYLHLGWAAPPALHVAAGVGQHAGDAVQLDAVDAQLGRHDQWPADAPRCLAQGGGRPNSEVLRGRCHVLWHEHFEGPMLSIKSVNALSHYTDWTIAHVHSGALGWNGFMTFGMLYWLLPRLFQTKLWSQIDELALLDRHDRHSAVHHSDLCGWPDARPDVARYRSRNGTIDVPRLY
jgi:cytochrome c oxidase cbb3-type subunit I/II